MTVSISAGATSGRSCATGLRRSITSSTLRSAASANMTAVRGGSASRTAARFRAGDADREARRCSTGVDRHAAKPTGCGS
jgi:hypothetical protein